MAELTIERAGHHASFLSKFKVSVDGEEVAKLGHGKSATVEVDPGIHTVHVHSLGTDGTSEIDVPDDGYELLVGYRTSLLAGAGSKDDKPQVEFWTRDEV